jgi:hypothetical protein
MSTRTILIIRHAEKPERDWPGPGLTVAGEPDDRSLVIRGWQRAGVWGALFGTSLGGQTYPVPSIVYAANPNATPDEEADDEPSQRPFETVSPLVDLLGKKPDITYAVGQEVELATAVVARSGVVLICWEHKAIARTLPPAILKGQSLPQIPTKWDGARFDVVLRFDRTAPGDAWSFRQLCPCLLSGDLATPMA